MSDKRPRLLVVAGFSGAGKTTLMEKLIPALTRRGLRVGAIKHHHGGLEMDREGKDSWRHKRAGAAAAMLAAPGALGLVADADGDPEPEALLGYFPGLDIVLAEGYKRSRAAKIEVWRAASGQPRACLGDETLIALVTDGPAEGATPAFGLDEADALADFLIGKLC